MGDLLPGGVAEVGGGYACVGGGGCVSEEEEEEEEEEENVGVRVQVGTVKAEDIVHVSGWGVAVNP